METQKEKQKQHLINMMALDEKLGLYEDGSPGYNKQAELVKQLAKQETVEEAAERVYPFVWDQAQYIIKLQRVAFIKGYEESQKISPDEDLIKAFEGGHDSARKKGSYKSNGTYTEDLKIWLTEFKNKLCQKE